MDPVASFYDRHPYPQKIGWAFGSRPHRWALHFNAERLCHLSYEAGLARAARRLASHEHKRILLVGCGTVEPFVFSYLHPRAAITAIDVSNKAVARAQRWAPDICFIEGDFLSDSWQSRAPSAFDYIHAYGSLHHMASLDEAFAKVSACLAPDGIARIMVYSQTGRAEINQLKQLMGSMAEIAWPHNRRHLDRCLRLLHSDHPLKATYNGHPETGTSSGFHDALCHPREVAVSLTELLSVCTRHHLSITAWDVGEPTLEREALGTWKRPFIFWCRPMSHSSKHPSDNDFLWTNPILYRAICWMKPAWHSRLLNRNIYLTPRVRRLLKELKEPRQAHSLAHDSQNIQALVEAGFLLRGSL